MALDAADPAAVAHDARIWEQVIRKLRIGAMPPPGRPRPEGAAAREAVAYLEAALDRVAAARPGVGRTETFHRLNRAEYRNAVRDLLHVDVDVSALLPADDADAHGFDNMAAVLSVSPALLERYLSAARKVSRLAVGMAPPVPSVDTHRIPLLLYQDGRLSEDLPLGSRGGWRYATASRWTASTRSGCGCSAPIPITSGVSAPRSSSTCASTAG